MRGMLIKEMQPSSVSYKPVSSSREMLGPCWSVQIWSNMNASPGQQGNLESLKVISWLEILDLHPPWMENDCYSFALYSSPLYTSAHWYVFAGQWLLCVGNLFCCNSGYVHTFEDENTFTHITVQAIIGVLCMLINMTILFIWNLRKMMRFRSRLTGNFTFWF